MKQDEDEWTKGSFRQMKDEGTIPKGRPPRQKRNGIGDQWGEGEEELDGHTACLHFSDRK